jgi:hypothetical protein
MNDDGIIAKTMSLWVFISKACPICHQIIVWVPPKPAFAATEVKFHGPYNKRTRLFLFFLLFSRQTSQVAENEHGARLSKVRI